MPFKTNAVLVVQKVGQDMRWSGAGRILITGSIAGFMPGTYQAVYNGTKAFLDLIHPLISLPIGARQTARC
jgi:short-subunit dehydrogenase